jgi:hypothetical protein
MFRKLGQFLIVLLVLPSLTLLEARASAGPSVGPSSCKARYLPLAREYRRKFQEKIEESTRTSVRLPKPQFDHSWNGSPLEGPGKCRWLFGGDPANLLMSLQP